MSEEKRGNPPSPRDYDRDVGNRVEKKPERDRGGDSPQQTHDDEDNG
ncbi:hypothetical protein [Luteibacter sp. CQ10]